MCIRDRNKQVPISESKYEGFEGLPRHMINHWQRPGVNSILDKDLAASTEAYNRDYQLKPPMVSEKLQSSVS